MKTNKYILIFSFLLTACGGGAIGPHIMKEALAVDGGTPPTYQYAVDISNLKTVPASSHGAHLGGLMEQVSFNGDTTSVLAKDITNEISWNFVRWPGGGTLKFKHLARTNAKGYGYDINEITAYINGGGGTAKDLEDWQRTYDQEQLLDYRYIDRFVEYYHSLNNPPDVVFGMNVTLGVLSEEMAALDYLADHGVAVVAVEMGNETYQQFNTFDEYYAKAEPFLQAVKAKYPSIVRTMVIAPNPDRNSHKKWNDAFKAKLAENDLIQGGVPHFYPDLSKECTDLYAAYNSTPKPNFEIDFETKDVIVGPIADKCLDDLNHIITDAAVAVGLKINSFESLKAYLDSQFPGLPLYMTEWNYLPVEGMANTVAEAVYVFKAIKKIQENPNIKIATTHQFVAPAGHGMVTPQNSSDSIVKELHRRAKYYAFLLHSYAQGYQEASLSLPFSGVTAYTYWKEGKLLIIGVNEGGEGQIVTSLGVPGYVTNSCTVTAVSGKQLYSGVGGTDFISRNNFYKAATPPYEMGGMSDTLSLIPPYSLFKVECDVSKYVAPPPPPPPPSPTKPWYCKYLPWLKECRR